MSGSEAADQRSQGGQASGHVAGGLAGVPLCQGLPYGTILAEVVTHRMLLFKDFSQQRVYDESTSYLTIS